MKFFNIFATTLSLFFLVQLNAQESKEGNFYGKEFKISQEIETAYKVSNRLTAKDTLQTQLKGKIKEVCQAKGCWMKVALDNNKEVFVRFKDYGFFVPTNSMDKKVVVNGAVFIEEMSVEDQKHYAKDRGDSPEEIAKIVKPKQQLRFEADGVYIQ